MRFALDEYVHLESPFHRWDVRFKLVGLLCVIFAFSFVRDLRLLPVMVALTVAMYFASRLPVSFLLRRLRYPSFFLLVVVVFLPFLSGDTVVASFGPVEVREEGLLAVLLISIRFLCILTVGVVLFGTAPFLTTVRAMRALGLPAVLADMMLLTFRYIFEIGDYLQRMRTSLRLRGFRARRFSARGLATLAWLGGSILVRSYERSQWVYRAMILRGYGYGPSPRHGFRSGPRDAVALVLAVVVAAAFVVGDILLRHGGGA